MVKCLECGAEEKRLQWTHFKFKCTGKFKNGKEYMLAYPGAKILDPDLASKTAITLENLILKYGNTEGNERWEKYKEKQAYSNSFVFKQEKYGWTREQFDSFNLSRAATLKNMISRHGEEEGIAKWEEYCKRQAYTNTIQYLIEKYGTEEGTRRYIEINKRKASPHDTKHMSSKIELEFVTDLEESIGKLEYSNKTKPFGKWSTLLNTYVIYDIKHKDCIIEFHGDYWHANPKQFSDNSIIRGKLAKDIWHRDNLKIQTAIDLGFRTLVVWASDYAKNKIETIEKVAEWILKEQK